MTNLERLKLELSKKDYYTDDEYKVFLEEQDLNPNDEYIKSTCQLSLLYTVIAVLETLSNNIVADFMSCHQTALMSCL